MNDVRNVGKTLRSPELHRRWMHSFRDEQGLRATARVVAKAIEMAGIPPGSFVLDAGCGTGTNSQRLVDAGFRVTGVDLSKFALQEATRAVAGARFVEGDLTKLPFDDVSYDGIFCLGVLMHVPDFEDALIELVRVLKPGGRLVLLENNENAPELRARRFIWKNFSKKIMIERRPHGTDVWSQTESGPLIARKVNITWLSSFLRTHSMTVVGKAGASVTELFNVFSKPIARRFFFGVNALWLKVLGPVALSLGIILVAEKRR